MTAPAGRDPVAQIEAIRAALAEAPAPSDLPDEAPKSSEPATDIERDVAANTPPVGISSRMVFSIVLVAIAGYAAVSGGILIWSEDATLVTGVVKSWEWGFTLALGYILGSSASSRNKDHRL